MSNNQSSRWEDYDISIRCAASSIGATHAENPGLWNVVGYGEMTTDEMLDLYRHLATNVPVLHRRQGSAGDKPFSPSS